MSGLKILDLIRRGRGNPLELLPSLLDAMPATTRRPLLELLELVRNSALVGPESPPPWAAQLFHQVGDAAELSPDLLAALSCVLSAYRPDSNAGRRSGLLGTPRAILDNAGATHAELAARDAAAAARVSRGALEGARWIEDRRRSANLVTALLEYLELGGSSSPHDDLERVLWVYLVLLSRRAQGEKLEQLEAVARG